MSDRIQQLMVSTPQGRSGSLFKDSRFVFNYETQNRAQEVSLTMPLRPESYASTILHSVFSMNKPEGWVLERIQRKFAKITNLDDMRLLALTGGNQIGRLRYAVPDAAKEPLSPQVGRKELIHGGTSLELFEYLADYYFASGISGVQPKLLVPDADRHPITDRATVIHSDLIVKSAGDEWPELTQNEFICMTAAKRAGIDVPEFYLSDDQQLFVMERFDLVSNQQIGFEDMAVLMAKMPSQKYEGSYENIAKVISIYCRENTSESLAKLFEYVAFSVMTRNGDAHLKNFGLLYDTPDGPPSPRIAPLYDVVTTSIYELISDADRPAKFDKQLAIKLNKTKRYPMRDELIAFGKDSCKVKSPSAILDRITDAMTTTLAELGGMMSEKYGTRMRDSWTEGMREVNQYIAKKNVKTRSKDSGFTP